MIEKIKDKNLNMGALMVLIGILIWVLPVKLVLTLFVLYGFVQIFWREEKIRDVHHHHHHHTTSGANKKKVKKKNVKSTKPVK